MAQVYGPWLTAAVLSIISIIGTLRIIVPRLVDAWIEDRQKARNSLAEAGKGERLDDAALLSQVVNLTNQLVEQNKTLVVYIAENLTGNITGMRNEIKLELRDIEKRWLAACQEITETKGHAHILSMEVAKLADNYKSLEERVVSLIAFGLEKNRD